MNLPSELNFILPAYDGEKQKAAAQRLLARVVPQIMELSDRIDRANALDDLAAVLSEVDASAAHKIAYTAACIVFAEQQQGDLALEFRE